MSNLQPLHRGLDVILSLNDKKLGGQHHVTLHRTMAPINITNKINGEWSQSLAGIKSWTLTCPGFIIKDEDSFLEIENCFSNGTSVNVLLADEDVAYTGTALITSFPISAPYNENFAYSVTLLGTSELEFEVKE